MTARVCPTPWKRAFESAAGARKSIVGKPLHHRTTGIGTRFRAYLTAVTNMSLESRRRKRIA